MSTSTPWGPAVGSHRFESGIVSYRTQTHGGIHLSAKRVQEMPEALRHAAAPFIRKQGDAWFEQKIATCLVFLSFPDVFGPAYTELAKATMANHYPDQYMALTGELLATDQSEVLQERAWRQLASTRPVVCTIWPDTDENVPQGMLGVFARVGGRTGSDIAGSNWLITQAEHEAHLKGPHGKRPFLIDPDVHCRVRVEFGYSRHKTATVKKMLEVVSH